DLRPDLRHDRLRSRLGDRDGELLHLPAGAAVLQLRLRGRDQLHPADRDHRDREHPRPADAEGPGMRIAAKQGLTWLVVVVALAFFLLPVVWILLTAFKAQGEVFHYPPVFWPKQIDFRHFSSVLSGPGGHALKDSLVIASANTGLSLLVGVPTAYSFSRFRVGGQHLAFWILSIRMFPPVASAVPLFLLFRKYQMLDTRWALIIAYLTFNVPFVVWFVKGFFDDLPRDLEEAALVDGATRWRAFTG